MSRRKRAIPSYLLHRPSGQARVRINGRDFYLGPYGSDESRQKYAELIQQQASGPVADDQFKPQQPADSISVAELVLAFLRHAESHYVKNGKSTSEVFLIKSAVRSLVDLFGLTPAVNFGPMALKTVREAMISAGWVRTSINSAVSRVRRVFKHGVECELIPVEVLQRLQAVAPLLQGRTTAPDRPRRSAVSQEQIDAVRAVVPELVRDLIDLQLLCGCRPGELLQLTGEMIDRSRTVWVAVLDEHKTAHHGHGRRIYFGPKARLILMRYFGKGPSLTLFPILRTSYTRAVTRGCEVAFKMPDHLRSPASTLTPEQLEKVRRQASEWRLNHVWSPHWLRHTAGKRLREEFGLEAAQAVLGHAKADMTEHYAGLAHARAIDAAAKAG